MSLVGLTFCASAGELLDVETLVQPRDETAATVLGRRPAGNGEAHRARIGRAGANHAMYPTQDGRGVVSVHTLGQGGCAPRRDPTEHVIESGHGAKGHAQTGEAVGVGTRLAVRPDREQ